MKLYRTTKIALATIFIPFLLHAQDAEKFSDKLFFGGNVGLQFGDYTYIYVNPLVGYRITPKLSGGLTFTYIYYRYKDEIYNYEYTSSMYGGSIFGRYLLTENLFAHVEQEFLNADVYTIYGEPAGRRTIPSLLVGGGYRIPMGQNSSVSILALFEILQDRDSPYQSIPIIRIGFGIGF